MNNIKTGHKRKCLSIWLIATTILSFITVISAYFTAPLTAALYLLIFLEQFCDLWGTMLHPQCSPLAKLSMVFIPFCFIFITFFLWNMKLCQGDKLVPRRSIWLYGITLFLTVIWHIHILMHFDSYYVRWIKLSVSVAMLVTVSILLFSAIKRPSFIKKFIIPLVSISMVFCRRLHFLFRDSDLVASHY